MADKTSLYRQQQLLISQLYLEYSARIKVRVERERERYKQLFNSVQSAQYYNLLAKKQQADIVRTELRDKRLERDTQTVNFLSKTYYFKKTLTRAVPSSGHSSSTPNSSKDYYRDYKRANELALLSDKQSKCSAIRAQEKHAELVKESFLSERRDQALRERYNDLQQLQRSLSIKSTARRSGDE